MRDVCRLFLVSGFVAICATAAAARADDLRGFWQPGAVVDYNVPLKENSSSQAVFQDHPLQLDKAKAAKKQGDEAAAIYQQAEEARLKQLAAQSQPQPSQFNQSQAPALQPASAQPVQQEYKPDAPLSRDQILAKFGDPDQPRLVKPQKDAPAEMQGLFEALNSGDKELAWRYSVAMARRHTQMQDLAWKATEYQVLAMEAMGMKPEQSLDGQTGQVSQERLELKELIEKTKRDRLAAKLNVKGALAALEQSEEQPSQTTPQSIPTEAIPVDPEGRVKLLVFFDEVNGDKKPLVESMKALKNKLPADGTFSAFGLTQRAYAPAGLKSIGAKSGFPFPLLNGEALSRDLQIVRYPTFVFVAATTKQTFRLEGEHSADEVEKVVRLMKGGR